MFWGEGSDRAARHSLRQALASLRRIFGADGTLLHADREAIALSATAVEVDVAAFESLGRAGTVQPLATAAGLYRGPLLDGFTLREELFEDWLAQERARLHDYAILLLLRLAELALDPEIATSALLRVLELDPLCEEAHRRLIRRHIDSGEYNAAVRQYNVCVDVLRRELDVAPEPQTTELYRSLDSGRAGERPPDTEPPRVASIGERKQVTVLCATLSPASSVDASGDPEQTQAALSPVLDEMCAIALRYGGNLISEAGDEFMAVFGAPVALESHAADACRAASDMRRAADRWPDFGFNLNIAIDSGEVVVRTRDQSLLPAGVFGSCVRRSAALARSGRVPTGATAATFLLARRFWRFASMDAVSLDSRAPAITLYAPLGPWPGRSGLDHFPAQLLSRFVGRQEEIAAIGSALATSAGGQGQMIAVVGEPGIGKSRLFHEFICNVPQEWRVVAARGDPQLTDAPYAPIARAIRSTLDIAVDERGEPSYEDLGRAVFALDPTLEPSLPALSSLLELAVPDPAWDALEPAQKRHQMIGAASLLFQRSAKRQPLVLMVEDLHWLDPASRTVLERIVEVLPAVRMLLMVNYRPDFAHDWGGRSFYRQIGVGPLSPATTVAFVDALVGSDVSTELLRHRLVTGTGGNPFFIEECIRSLEHSGAISGERGAFRAERASDPLTLPETVQAVIAARIDQLAACDKTVLRIAAVIGNEVPYALLGAVSDLGDDALRATLRRLQASEFLIETSFSTNASYRFKHALTNEVAYATLLQQARRALHARILGALEEQHAARLDEHVEALAYHSSRGEVFEKAAEYGRRAGLKAVARAANRAAVAHFGQALSALGHLPETTERIVEEIDLRFQMRNALFVLGEHHLIMDHLRRAEALAERTQDAFRRGYTALHIGGWFWQQGQQQSSRDASERAFAIATEIDSRELTALAWYRIGLSRHASGEYRCAIDSLLRCVSMLEEDGRTNIAAFGGYPYAFCCSFLSWSFAELGAYAPAREWGLRGRRFAAERNHTYTQSVTTFGLGLCYVREGNFEEARSLLERGLEYYRVGDVPVSFSWVASPLGFTYVAQGERERGFELLHRALEVDQPHLHRAQLELWLADACLMSGLGDEAWDAARRAKQLAQMRGEQAHTAWAERVLGDVASASNPVIAHGHYERAIVIARPLELHSNLTAALLGRSRLLEAEGRAGEAQSLREEAKSLIVRGEDGYPGAAVPTVV